MQVSLSPCILPSLEAATVLGLVSSCQRWSMHSKAALLTKQSKPDPVHTLHGLCTLFCLHFSLTNISGR